MRRRSPGAPLVLSEAWIQLRGALLKLLRLITEAVGFGQVCAGDVVSFHDTLLGFGQSAPRDGCLLLRGGPQLIGLRPVPLGLEEILLRASVPAFDITPTKPQCKYTGHRQNERDDYEDDDPRRHEDLPRV